MTATRLHLSIALHRAARALVMRGYAELYDPDQPRDEIGRWTDTGASDDQGAGAMMDFLSKVVPASDFGNGQYHFVFHGTSAEAAEGILQNGLRAIPAMGRPPSVYFTTDQKTAEDYMGNLISGKDEFGAVIEFRIPQSQAGRVKRDEVDYHFWGKKTAYRFEGDISPDWIMNVHTYRKQGREIREFNTSIPSNTGYIVIIGKIPKPANLTLRHIADLARNLIGLDYSLLRAGYVDDITGAMMDYMSGDSAITRFRNSYKRAVLEFWDASYFTAYLDSGGNISQMSAEDRQWILGKMAAEIGFVDMLFQSLKALRKELEGQSQLAVVDAVMRHSEMYAHALDGVYAQGYMRGGRDELYLFGGPDGEESCATCQKLKGQEHTAGWVIERDLIPYPSNSQFICGGWMCQHSWTSLKTGKVLMG